MASAPRRMGSTAAVRLAVEAARRSMRCVDHALDLELLAFALASEGVGWPAMVLLDMEAAFPSVSHHYLLRAVLKFAGAHPVADMVADMHSGASTQLLVNGEVRGRAGHRRLPGRREGRLRVRRLRLR